MVAAGGWVVLSPHLDDAVLSLGALIARRVRDGEPVEVWTAFTRPSSGGPVPRRLRQFADYGARIAEDDRALAVLGADARRLDLPERIWRRPPARGLRAAFRTPRDRTGFQELERLQQLAGEALATPGVRVLAPLGVGHHVDHVEVGVAVLTVALRDGATERVAFYEDFYALGNASRGRHPVTRQDAGSGWRRVRESPGWAAPAEGLVLWGTPLITSGPPPSAYLDGSPRLSWLPERHPVDPWSEERQLAAVAQYRTQTPALGGTGQLGRLLRRAHRVRGGDVIWSVRPR